MVVLYQSSWNGNTNSPIVSSYFAYGAGMGGTTPLYQSQSAKVGTAAPTVDNVWYHSDGLGSVRALTDSTTGALRGGMSYTAFGEAAGNVAGADGKKAPEVTHRFAGEQLDPTGLYFNRARYYHPALGRFMSLDPLVGNPLDPTSYNRYMYARNNPVVLTDPTGKEAFDPLKQWNENCQNFPELCGPIAQKQLDPSYFFRFLQTPSGYKPAIMKDAAEENDPGNEIFRRLIRKAASEASDSVGGSGSSSGGGADSSSGGQTNNRPKKAHEELIEEIDREKAQGRDVSQTNSQGRNWDFYLNNAEEAETLLKRASWRRQAKASAWTNAPDRYNEQGEVIGKGCPTCGKELQETIQIQRAGETVNRQGFDLDHYVATWERRIRNFVNSLIPPTRRQVIDLYNQDIRVQCIECNQGHSWEGRPGPYENGIIVSNDGSSLRPREER